MENGLSLFNNGTDITFNVVTGFPPLGFEIELDTWFHFAYTFHPNTLLHTFYVNGTEVSTLIVDPGSLNHSSLNTLAIGAHHTVSGNFFHGSFGDVSLYSEPLTKTNVEELMNKTKLPTDYASVIGWYEFLGNSQDSSGNARHLDDVSAPTYVG